jgi:hypothetical protein
VGTILSQSAQVMKDAGLTRGAILDFTSACSEPSARRARPDRGPALVQLPACTGFDCMHNGAARAPRICWRCAVGPSTHCCGTRLCRGTHGSQAASLSIAIYRSRRRPPLRHAPPALAVTGAQLNPGQRMTGQRAKHYFAGLSISCMSLYLTARHEPVVCSTSAFPSHDLYRPAAVLRACFQLRIAGRQTRSASQGSSGAHRAAAVQHPKPIPCHTNALTPVLIINYHDAWSKDPSHLRSGSLGDHVLVVSPPKH